MTKRKKSMLMAVLVMAAMSLMSCTVVGQENKFTITGKDSDFADGKKVYLIKSVESQEIPVVDSTVVRNHSFVLEGQVETPYIAVVGVADSLMAQEVTVIELIVEPGNIQIGAWEDDKHHVATGTPLNDANM